MTNKPAARVGARVALTALILTTMSTGAFANYKAKAMDAMDFIQSKLYDPTVGLYRPSEPANPRDLPYEFMWGNGVQFTALVSATQYEPAKYRPILYSFSNGLKKYWDTDAPVPGFDAYFSSKGSDDKYYDDNAWLVLGMVEAYEVTRDKSFLDWARQVQDFCLSGWDDKLGGGIYWYQDKKSKNTCVNAPTAAAAARLYQAGNDKEQLAWAKRLVEWTTKTLEDPKDSIYWDNIHLDGKVEETKWTYNTGLMIRANVLLYEITKDKKYLADAKRQADASIKHWSDPETGAIRDGAKFNHLLSESFLRLYDVTKDLGYLNTVRRNASFGYRHVRDPKGGYWNDWEKKTRAPGERKAMIENAATARLFWLLVPYDDVEELQAKGVAAAAKKDLGKAENYLRQAMDSDTEAVEARYELWKVLDRRKKTAEANQLAAKLSEMAKQPEWRQRLEAAGWRERAT